MHRGSEADDDDRHQPDHEAAARPLFWFAHGAILSVSRAATGAAASSGGCRTVVLVPATRPSRHERWYRLTWKCRFEALQTSSHSKAVRNDFFGEMAETGGVPLNASPVRRWAGVFGHRPFAFSISMGVKTSDGMNWNLQDLVYEALSEEWRKRDGEISDPWANDEADGYQPPSYEPVNPERRTAQTPSDGLI